MIRREPTALPLANHDQADVDTLFQQIADQSAAQQADSKSPPAAGDTASFELDGQDHRQLEQMRKQASARNDRIGL